MPPPLLTLMQVTYGKRSKGAVVAVAESGSRRRGIIIGALAGIVVVVISVLLRNRNSPDLLVRSDEGWQPDVRAAIGGEVVSPGTYTLRGDARLSDLVAAAGGYTAQAERGGLNPAARLSDGMEYTIPVQSARTATAANRLPTGTAAVQPTTTTAVASSAPVASATPGRTASSTPTAQAPLNINTATKEQLEALPAIGPAIAQRIVDDRAANGPYKQIEDLARVRGISARTVDQLRGRITVGP